MKRDWNADELIEHWTLLPGEKPLLANKTGPTRLGFAVLLKFFQHEGCFPRQPQEVPERRGRVRRPPGRRRASAEWAHYRLGRPHHQVPPRPDPEVPRLSGGHRGRRRRRSPPGSSNTSCLTTNTPIISAARSWSVAGPCTSNRRRRNGSTAWCDRHCTPSRRASVPPRANACRRRSASAWKRCCCRNRPRQVIRENRRSRVGPFSRGCSPIPAPPTWKASWRRSQNSTRSGRSACRRTSSTTSPRKSFRPTGVASPRKRPTNCDGTRLRYG